MRLPRATPIYVMGDSHAVAFDDRLAWLGSGIDRLFVFRTLYCPGLRAAACVDANGRIAQPVADALRAASLVVQAPGGFEAFHRSRDPHWLAVAGAASRWPRRDPAIALSVGGLDVLDIIAGWPYDEIEPPPGLSGADAERWPTADPDSAAASAAWFRDRFAAVGGLLAQLQHMGFERLALLPVVPPVALDRAFRLLLLSLDVEATEPRYRLGLRYKLVLHANAALRRIARNSNVHFIDRWPDQTNGGLGRRDLLGDGIHLSDASADRSAAAVVSALFEPAVAQRDTG